MSFKKSSWKFKFLCNGKCPSWKIMEIVEVLKNFRSVRVKNCWRREKEKYPASLELFQKKKKSMCCKKRFQRQYFQKLPKFNYEVFLSKCLSLKLWVLQKLLLSVVFWFLPSFIVLRKINWISNMKLWKLSHDFRWLQKLINR